MKGSILFALVILGLTLSASPVPAQSASGSIKGVVIAERETARGDRQLLVTSPAEMSGELIDEIRLTLPKKIARRLDAALLPGGWEMQSEKSGVILSGPPKEDDLLAVALDVAETAPIDEVTFELWSGGREIMSGAGTPLVLEPVKRLETAEGWLELPRGVTPGEKVEFSPANPKKTPAGGSWTINDDDVEWNGDLSDSGYEWTVGADYEIGTTLRLSATYTDAWGETLIDGQTSEITIVPPGDDDEPTVTDCSPKVLTDGILCVCGNFPTPLSQAGLTLNGQPLGRPLSSSSRVLTFRLPEGVPAGEFTVVGSEAAGYGPGNQTTGEHITVGGSVDRDKLRRGQSTPLTLWIDGTTDPISMRLWNDTPDIVSLQPEEHQQVTTSGGSPNQVVRQVDAVSPGDFEINYELTLQTCPCTEGMVEEPDDIFAEDEEWDFESHTRCRDMETDCEVLRVLAELADEWAKTLRRVAKEAAKDTGWHEAQADWLDEAAESNQEQLEIWRRQAAAWRELAEDSRAYAKVNWQRHKDLPGKGWDDWARYDEETARRRDEAADAIEEDIERLEGETRRESGAADELRDRTAEAERMATEAEAEAEAAWAAYEACVERWREEREWCEQVYGASHGRLGTVGLDRGTTAIEDDADDGTTIVPGGAPVGEEEEDDGVCPQRDGEHENCVALLIDMNTHGFWEPGSLTDSKEWLEELGCDVDYAAPYFLPVPPKYYTIEKDVLNGETGEWETVEEVVETDRSQNANLEYNRLEMGQVLSAIERHRRKLRAGAIMGIEMVNAHGSLPDKNRARLACGRVGPSIDFAYGNGIDRKAFHEGNYEAAKGNVCIWHVVDNSCYSWQTPRAIDELTNYGYAECTLPQAYDRRTHAGYEMDVAQSCSKQGWIEICVNADMAYLEDDINDVWEDEIDRQDDADYDHTNAFKEMLSDLGEAAQSDILNFSTYTDNGYATCEPAHTRVGPYWY